MRNTIFRWTGLSACLLLTACYEHSPHSGLAPSSDYSPNYTYINVVSEDGRSKRILVPEACLAAGAHSPADGSLRPPPGCANNYNLQRMVERKNDVIRGRPLGHAAAAPAARAAQDYIDGKQEPALGGGIRSDSPGGGGQPSVTEEPAETR